MVDSKQYEQAIHESYLREILFFHQFTKDFSLEIFPLYGIVLWLIRALYHTNMLMYPKLGCVELVCLLHNHKYTPPLGLPLVLLYVLVVVQYTP